MTGNFAPAKISTVSAEASVEASVMPEFLALASVSAWK
jgi:hypothetical protein